MESTRPERPLTPQDIMGLLNIVTPPAPARARFNIDAIAVLDACRELQIEKGVWFRWTTAQHHAGKHGYQYAKGTLYHRILIDQNAPIIDANRTMWHELAHAAQLEAYMRAGKKPQEWDSDYWAFTEYKTNPFEIEAEGIASLHRDVWLLKAK